MSWHKHLKSGSLALAGEDYTQAQSELALALKAAESTCANHAGIGVIYGLLAQSYFKHAKFEQAEPLLKKAISIDSKDAGKAMASAKTRDLICLAEILKNKGAAFESLAYLENVGEAIGQTISSPLVNGGIEFDALKHLFSLVESQSKKATISNAIYNTSNSAGLSTTSSTSKVKERDFKAASQKIDEHSHNSLDQLLTMLSEQQHRVEIGSFLYFSGAEKSQSFSCGKFESIQNEDDLEKEYIRLIQELRLLPKLQTRVPGARVEKLVRLVKVSLSLQLPEQAEMFLQDAFAYAFGSENGDHLTLPKTQRHGLPSALVIELMLARAQFHFYLYDYAAAARCFADLMQWLESNELMCIDSEQETNLFVGSFITLMQRADLYAAARILIKQAIEFEEYGEIRRALKTYDKALLLSEQLFPNNHLEIAQLLQMKSSALRLCGKKSESHIVAKRAAQIEAFAGESARLAENRLSRLPRYKSKV